MSANQGMVRTVAALQPHIGPVQSKEEQSGRSKNYKIFNNRILCGSYIKIIIYKIMRQTPEKMSSGKKAQRTAKCARTMTKWLITYCRRSGAKWNLVDFGGKTKAESRGIVDMIAIRKAHRHDGPGLRRGDLFEIVLIQTKGGSAHQSTPDDVARLSQVRKHHRAKAVVLSEWRRGGKPELFKLNRNRWQSVSPHKIFG
jgi:hypothetical protein